MLTGTLDDFTLDDVLRLIGGARRTGGLEVTREGGAGTLFFRDGAVSRAVRAFGRRADATSPGRAIEDLTFDLMRRERGEFTWTPGTPAPAGPEADLDVQELLRGVAGRLEELAEIQSLVPSEDAVLTMAPQPPEGAVQINITPGEWRVLVLVDGHRSVREIAGAAHLDELGAMKLLYGLATAGLVAAGPIEDTPSQQVSDTTDMTDTTAVSDIVPEDTFTASAAPEEPEPPAPVQEPAPVEEPEPFLAGLVGEPASPFGVMPAAPVEAPAVDRSTAARELAGLFDDVDPTSALGGMTMAGPPVPPRVPRRVEDDDQVTRGLISRLIDGVKGL
jgi:Domain of unknown function (DUF4388)